MRIYLLNGGEGKRLRPITNKIPKCLVLVAGKPLLYWQLKLLQFYGVDEAIILIRSNYVEPLKIALNEMKEFNEITMRIKIVNVGETKGTAETLSKGFEIYPPREHFLVMNGDILTTIDPLTLFPPLYNHYEAEAVIALINPKLPWGVVKMLDDKIVRFEEKPILKKYLINAGIYAMKPSAKRYIDGQTSLEEDTFPWMAENRVLLGKKYNPAYWRALDTVKDVDKASEEWPKILEEFNFER